MRFRQNWLTVFYAYLSATERLVGLLEMSLVSVLSILDRKPSSLAIGYITARSQRIAVQRVDAFQSAWTAREFPILSAVRSNSILVPYT